MYKLAEEIHGSETPVLEVITGRFNCKPEIKPFIPEGWHLEHILGLLGVVFDFQR